MARRKRSGGKKKMNWVDKIFGILGFVVAAGPAIQAVQTNLSNPGNIPRDMAYRYTGFDVSNGSLVWQQTAAGIGTVAVGGVVAGIPRIFRMVKRLVGGK